MKLVADDGTIGYGEVYTATFNPHVVAEMIEDVCERHVIGHDPFHIEALWRNVYGRGYTSRPDISLISVLSGIEIACWDLIGKAVDKPVYELLGGQVHERLRSYTYLYPTADDGPDPFNENRVYSDPQLAAQRASEEVERGFTAVKFDPAGPYTVHDGHMPSLEAIEPSRAFVSAIREAVGTRADLLFGTHGQFTAAGASRLAQALEPFDPMWFEEPVPPDNIEEMARVARQTSTPIATGERLTTKYEFARVVEAQAAAILQPALGRSGGILETKKIAAIAETHHVQIAPHLYCGPNRSPRQHRPRHLHTQLLDPRIDPDLRWFPRRTAHHAHQMARRSCNPADRRGPRHSPQRRRRPRQPLHRHRLAPRTPRTPPPLAVTRYVYQLCSI